MQYSSRMILTESLRRSSREVVYDDYYHDDTPTSTQKKKKTTETLLNAHLGYNREKRNAQEHNEVHFFLNLHYYSHCLYRFLDGKKTSHF